MRQRLEIRVEELVGTEDQLRTLDSDLPDIRSALDTAKQQLSSAGQYQDGPWCFVWSSQSDGIVLLRGLLGLDGCHVDLARAFERETRKAKATDDQIEDSMQIVNRLQSA